MADVQLALSFEEVQRLEVLEDVIERGRRTFVEVGQALMEIRDGKLYRQHFATFEDYCRERWLFSRFTAYDLIKATEVVGVLTTVNKDLGSVTDVRPPLPANEAQARELAPLRKEPELMREVWREAVEVAGGQPTAAVVREVREELQGRPMAVHYSSDREDWETPQDLFDQLNAEFDFELDVCASPRTAKCERFFTREQDGLAQVWQGVCWMNPPYGDAIGDWMKKAWEASVEGAVVVCLVPARTDTAWWWDYARFGEVRFLRGRLRFVGAESGAPFPSAVVVFGAGPACVKWWVR